MYTLSHSWPCIGSIDGSFGLYTGRYLANCVIRCTYMYLYLVSSCHLRLSVIIGSQCHSLRRQPVAWAINNVLAPIVCTYCVILCVYCVILFLVLVLPNVNYKYDITRH